jgi:hypothetical protein
MLYLEGASKLPGVGVTASLVIELARGMCIETDK